MRVAAAYGTPQATNLFVTPAGVPGNNTTLDAQTMRGLDIGIEWAPVPAFSTILTGYYEIFRNELISQSAGANLLSYTFNAPESEHRGIEAAFEWRPFAGACATAAHLYNEQTYEDFKERLSAGAFSTRFDRSGNLIPGVPKQALRARIGYDAPTGLLKGVGGFLETNWRESTFADNANLMKTPCYTLINANLHYDPPEGLGALSRTRFFVSAPNLTDRVCVSSASNVANSLSAMMTWLSRRPPGVLGAPEMLERPRFSFALLAAVATLAVLFPLHGASLVLVLLVERLILRRVPSVRRWLGLEEPRRAAA